MISFLSDSKIDIVNTKFATSILNETIKILNLLHCSGISDIQKDKRNKNITTITTHKEDKNLIKFTTDVNNIKCSFKKVISELGIHRKFTDFSGASVAVNELKFLEEYNQNEWLFEESISDLNEIKERIANHHEPTETVDESIIKCAIRSRFIKTYEKARKDQNDHFYRMLICTIEDEISEYSRKIEFENSRILEIENYSLAEMEMHKAESIKWSEKFDTDLNKTEIDIQIAMNELDAMKMNYENKVESIKHRDQEMKDFTLLKKEREEQKDSELMKLIYGYKNHLFAKCQILDKLE